MDDLGSLKPQEQIVFNTLMNETFHAFRHTFYRSKEGIVGMEEWTHSTKPQVQELLLQSGVREWWVANKVNFPNDFVDELTDDA